MTPETSKLLGVILSGGRSQRMGSDKSLIAIGNTTLLDHAYQRLSCQFAKIKNTNSNKDEIIVSTNNPLLLAKDDKIYLADSDDFNRLGPLSGIYAAMEYGKKHHYQALITIAVDTPFFPLDYVEKLHDFHLKNPEKALLSTYEGALQPTFGLWPIDLIDQLNIHLQEGKRSIYSFAQKINAGQYDFGNDVENNPFFNVNTPEELQIAKTLWF